jgi:DNA-directed RNA polymerase sigma subunit (sigma70/sigma32)
MDDSMTDEEAFDWWKMWRAKRDPILRAAWDQTNQLTDLQRKVLKLRWGAQHTLAEVGDWVGVSRAEARQIEKDAMRTMQDLHRD